VRAGAVARAGVGRRARWVVVGVAFLAVVAALPALIVGRLGPGHGSDARPDGTLAVGPGPEQPSPSGATPTAGTAQGGTQGTGQGTASGTGAVATRTPSPHASAPASVLATPVQPRPAATPPRAQYQEFLVTCGPLGTGRASLGGGPAVPVAVLGAPASVPGLAPPAGTAPGRSSCLTAGDASTYWAPQLTVGGRAVAPSSAEIYYKSPVRDYTAVQPFPAGLRLETADLAAVTASGGSGSWSCGTARGPDLPPSCPDGARLVARLQSPGCWDGVRLDSPDHRSHLSYPLGDRCPGTHPVAVPMIELKLVYTVAPGPTTARLATGGGTSFRFGFLAGWDRTALDRLVTTCVNAGRRCGPDGAPG